MNRKILIFFLICSCILLPAQQTLAQEEDLIDDSYVEDIALIAVAEEDIKENTATDDTLNSEEELNSVDISSDINIIDFDTLAVPTDVNDTEIKLKIEQQETTNYIENIPNTGTLYKKILKSDSFLSKLEENIFTESNILKVDERNNVWTDIVPQSTDSFETSLANIFMTTNAAETVDSMGVEDTTVTKNLDAELTTADNGETTYINTVAPTTHLYETDEAKVDKANGNSSIAVAQTANDAIAIETTSTPAISSCTAPGSFAVENDCRSYFICIPTVRIELKKVQRTCPIEEAFDKKLSSCSRDLSPCADAFDCKAEGTFADPIDNSSYYWCVASRLNAAYHVYHVKCGHGQIYTPELGKCFIDMKALQSLSLGFNFNMMKSPDEKYVQEEVNISRAREKSKFKETKLREKIQRKYEKELRKQAAKKAKEQRTINCAQQGNFAVAGESFYDYFICLSKKGEYKTLGMKCPNGQNFSVTQGFCTS